MTIGQTAICQAWQVARRLADLFGTTLELLWNYFGTTLELLWNYFGITQFDNDLQGKMLWNHFLGQLWNYFGTTLELLWNYFGTTLELLWNYFGTTLEPLLWNYFATAVIPPGGVPGGAPGGAPGGRAGWRAAWRAGWGHSVTFSKVGMRTMWRQVDYAKYGPKGPNVQTAETPNVRGSRGPGVQVRSSNNPRFHDFGGIASLTAISPPKCTNPYQHQALPLHPGGKSYNCMVERVAGAGEGSGRVCQVRSVRPRGVGLGQSGRVGLAAIGC